MSASTCTECGQPLREGAQFCPACGSELAAVEPLGHADATPTAPVVEPTHEHACTECGHGLRDGAQFCPVCGSAVAAAVSSEVVSAAVPVMTPRAAHGADVAAPVVPMTPSPPPAVPTSTRRLERATQHPSRPPIARPPTATGAGDAGLGARRRPDPSDRRVLAAAGGLLALVIAGILVLLLGGAARSMPSATRERGESHDLTGRNLRRFGNLDRCAACSRDHGYDRNNHRKRRVGTDPSPARRPRRDPELRRERPPSVGQRRPQRGHR